MRSNGHVAGCVLVAVLSLGVGACAKKADDACVTGGNLVCDDARTVLACVGKKLVAIPCAGPMGCSESATGIGCDPTVASGRQSCPPWANSNTVCQTSPSALLTCSAGLWRTTRPAQLLDGGGCSAATCPSGRCSSTGRCVLDQNARACGTGGCCKEWAMQSRTREPHRHAASPAGFSCSPGVCIGTVPTSFPARQGFELMIVRPNADAGIMQQVDENEVAAMLFEISNNAPSGLGQIHNALASQRRAAQAA